MATDLTALIARARSTRAALVPAQKAGAYDHIDFRPPEGVRAALRRGLELHEQGHSGDGLKPETVAWARRLAAGEAISPEKARTMRAWLARHAVDRRPGWATDKTPGYVAWLLWGGDDAEGWSDKLVRQMEAADRDAKKVTAGLESLIDLGRRVLAEMRHRDASATKDAGGLGGSGNGAAAGQASGNLTGADTAAVHLPPAIGVPKKKPTEKAQADGVEGPAPEVPKPVPATKDEAAPADELPPKLVDFGGIPVLVDRPKGFVQTKTDDAGNVLWTRTYAADYGYLAGTEGGDHEGLDVFLGPDPTATTAFWTVQISDDGSFDEYKLLLGFPDEASARACYVEHIPEKYLAALAPMPVDRLRALLGLPIESIDPVTKATALLDAVGELTGLRQKVELVASTKASSPEEQFIFGIVLKPEVADLQKEIYAHKVVRDTAHLWMAEFRNTDLQHKMFINDAADPVESTIEKVAYWMAQDGEAYPADPATGAPIGAPDGAKLRFVPKGSWTVAHHIKDAELWAQIKAGKYTGYSINGLSKKVPLRPGVVPSA